MPFIVKSDDDNNNNNNNDNDNNNNTLCRLLMEARTRNHLPKCKGINLL